MDELYIAEGDDFDDVMVEPYRHGPPTLAMRDAGEAVSVRHSLAMEGRSWAVNFVLHQTNFADEVLSLAQLTGVGEAPEAAAPLPEELALAARALAGDEDAVRSWLDSRDLDEIDRANLRAVLE